MKKTSILLTAAFISSFAVGGELTFESPEAVIYCGNQLINLATMGKYQQVFEMSSRRADFSRLTSSDAIEFQESYAFALSYAQIISHVGLAKRADFAREEKIRHFRKVGILVELFEREYKEIYSVRGHLSALYIEASGAFASLSRMYDSSSDDLRDIYGKCIRFYEMAIEHGDDLDSILTLRHSLFTQHAGAYQYFPEHKQESLKKMRLLKKELDKSGREDIKQQVMQQFEVLENFDKLVELQAPGRRSNASIKRAENYHRNKLIAGVNEINSSELLADTSEKKLISQREIFVVQIAEQLEAIDSEWSRARPDYQERLVSTFSSIKDSIFEIERAISNSIALSADVEGMTSDLLSIYREYYRLMGSYTPSMREAAFLAISKSCLSSLIIAGDLEEALERGEAFKTILEENSDTNAPMLRIEIAYIKSLLGDHTEWLKIEAEANKKAAANKRKKEAQKKRAHEEKIKAIQGVIEEKRIEEGYKEHTEQRRLESLTEQRNRSNARKEEMSLAAVPEIVIGSSISASSSIARVMRHEAAVKERTEAKEQVKMQRLAHPSIAEATTSADDGLAEKDAAFLIRDLYQLTGAPLAVDDAIENNVWNFTREQLVDYYNALGCEHRSGKGSHEVTSLPKSLIVSRGDEVITVVSDSGGSLTLPRWEDKVPHYLKKQILAAREKLVALASKALKA